MEVSIFQVSFPNLPSFKDAVCDFFHYGILIGNVLFVVSTTRERDEADARVVGDGQA